ncbi:MAG: hypothetical protein ACXWEL_02715 [Solirubrobacterales bacterium]
MTLDLDSYSERAERFLEEIDREHYLHGAGCKAELEIETIYARHAGLFDRGSVQGLREAAGGERGREARQLLHFAFDGHLGEATKAEAAELARLEASLEVEGIPYRAVPAEIANEPDAERRAALETARDELLEQLLNPLHLETLERSQALARDLGWRSYRDAYADLRGIDLTALAATLAGFLARTDAAYAPVADPEIEPRAGARLGELRRSDLPRFFRAADLDAPFGEARFIASFSETMAGLGIDLEGQRNVHLDTEVRPTKSPRAFCATPRVPEEVYLVVRPVGGREDFAALFHEGGHTEHYANTEAALPLAHRQLGDNAVTESFAFLFEHLTEDPEWLRSRLAIEDHGPVVRHARAVKLVMLRRYAAKIAYEVELLGPGADLAAMPQRYAELLGGATRVRWPRQSWLADVDGGFYVACYLRAWALELGWRGALRERFGERWFEHPESGDWLRGLWSQGQRLDAEELLSQTLGSELDFGALADELVGG